MTKWKPAKRVPMLGNGPRFQLGQIQALPVLVRWGLPWLLTAGGIALTSYVATKAVPDIPINKQKIGLSAALAGAGFTAYFLSSTIPDNYKPIAYAAAVAGIAGGAYFLFSTPEKTEADRVTASPNIAPEQVVPKYTPGPMLQNFVVQEDPKQTQTNGRWRQPFGNQTFDVLVSNNSSQPFTFFTGVRVYDSDQVLLYASPQIDPAYGRAKTTVAPGGQEVVKVTLPRPGNWGGPDTSGHDLALEFNFFRQQNDPNPFKVSNSIPINYSLFSGAESILGQTNLRGETRPIVSVEVHDEMNPQHVMGCKKCKRKKKKTQLYTLPTVPLTYPPSGMM